MEIRIQPKRLPKRCDRVIVFPMEILKLRKIVRMMGDKGSSSQAFANSASAFADAPVARIDVHNGRARGVTLESGEELRADVVIAATHPKITFLDQIDRAALPPDFVTAIER